MEELVLAKNGRSIISLKGRGSAGYRWAFTIDNPQIATVERIVTTEKPEPRHPATYSLDEQFAIIALSAGETIVRFTLSRPFEQSKPPIAHREIRIKVRAN